MIKSLFYLSCLIVGVLSYVIASYISLLSLQKDYFQAIKSEFHIRSEAKLVNAHLETAVAQLEKVDGFVKNLEEMVLLKANSVYKDTGIGPLSPNEDLIFNQNIPKSSSNKIKNALSASQTYKHASSLSNYRSVQSSLSHVKKPLSKTVLGISVEDFVLRPLVQDIDHIKVSASRHSYSLKNMLLTLQKHQHFLSSIPIGKPVQGWIASSYGYRISPFSGNRSMHYGIDIAAPVGSPIYAPADGVVIFSGTKSGFGKFLMIAHDHGIVTKYGHNSDLLVKTGERINRGDPIAAVGSTGRSTGPHLHYEVWVNGKPRNPYNFILQTDLSLNL